MSIQDDLAGCLPDLADGHTAVIGEAAPVACIYTADYQTVDLYGQAAESSGPRITVAGSVPAAHGDAVLVYDEAGEVAGSYTVRNIQASRPDGRGLLTILLTAA